MLREFRAQMLDELGALARSLRRIEQQAGEQAARRAGDSENLHGLLKRVASIERILAVTELRRTMARARVDPFFQWAAGRDLR